MLLEVLIAVVIIYLLDFLWCKSKNNLTKSIPMIKGLPILGVILESKHLSPDKFIETLKEYRMSYGKTYKYWVCGQFLINTSDPKYIETILSNTKNIRKHLVYNVLRDWLGDGLLVSGGAKWHFRRKIITPTFHFKILEQFVDIFDQQTNILLTKLEPKADGTTIIDIYPLIALATLDIIAETAMGTQINAQLDPHSPYAEALLHVTEIISARFMNPITLIPPIYKLFFRSMYQKQTEGIAIMHKFTKKIIEERRATLLDNKQHEINQENSENGIKKRLALLDVLLQATTPDGKALSNEDIREEVDTFLFEGHDTTTTSISFALRTLARHPHVQQNLIEEIQNIYGSDLKKPITYHSLQGMRYMDCVIKECLRIMPPIPVIGRRTSQDIQMDNFTIPAGTNIIILLWELQRDPVLFEDPELFKPERFFEHNFSSAAFHYLPFSAGLRNCVGQKFAILEMKCMITKILQRFELLPLGEDPRHVMDIVLKPINGINVGFKPRS